MERLLIIGCGDIARRTIALIGKRYRTYALVRNRAQRDALRAMGVVPLMGDLDNRKELSRIAGLADVVLHFAPPPNTGIRDMRTRHLLAALARGTLPRQLIYISTSGVYGDCGGDWVKETRIPNPQSARAQRRVDAEAQIRAWARGNRVKASILRVPGIYAEDRLPLERVQAGMPAILKDEDSYTNHIHANDLAHIVVSTLRRARANRVYQVGDDDVMKMGDYFDIVADAHHLPHPPRISRAEAQRTLPESLLSFMNESRRLSNERMKLELQVRLQYPSVRHALESRLRD